MGIYFVFFLAAIFILFACMIASAPEGYEDEEGFHYGKEDKLNEVEE